MAFMARSLAPIFLCPELFFPPAVDPHNRRAGYLHDTVCNRALMSTRGEVASMKIEVVEETRKMDESLSAGAHHHITM